MHRRRAQRILVLAELAPLPKSATEVRSYSKVFLFTGINFLRFHASQADIEAFLRESPILKEAKCTIYSKDRPRQDEYFFLRKAVPNITPSWYIPSIRGTGRGYRFWKNRYKYDGKLLVDEEKNLVFVELSFG